MSNAAVGPLAGQPTVFLRETSFGPSGGAGHNATVQGDAVSLTGAAEVLVPNQLGDAQLAWKGTLDGQALKPHVEAVTPSQFDSTPGPKSRMAIPATGFNIGWQPGEHKLHLLGETPDGHIVTRDVTVRGAMAIIPPTLEAGEAARPAAVRPGSSGDWLEMLRLPGDKGS